MIGYGFNTRSIWMFWNFQFYSNNMEDKLQVFRGQENRSGIAKKK